MTKWMFSALTLVACGLTAMAADNEIKVKEGDKAPNISLPATSVDKVLPDAKDAKSLDLAALKGKKHVVLFFYPKAMTGGCTIESCGFRDITADLAKLDTVVIGISIDKLSDQQKFTDKESLNFPLLADSDGKITKEFGVMAGTRPVSQRVTFIIDKEGVIRKIYTKVTPKTHPKEVIDFVEKELAK